VTVKAFTTLHLSTLTCFGHHRPSSEGTSVLSETTITVYALIFKIYTHTIFVKHTLNKIQTCYNYSCCSCNKFGALKSLWNYCLSIASLNWSGPLQEPEDYFYMHVAHLAVSYKSVGNLSLCCELSSFSNNPYTTRDVHRPGLVITPVLNSCGNIDTVMLFVRPVFHCKCHSLW
jgi:hypothetical protein